MYIFEVTTPGTWLDYPDREWAWKIENLLRHLNSQFYEANTALNLFEESRSRQSSGFTREQWEADADRRSQIWRDVEREIGFDLSPESWDRTRNETELRFKREKWAAGHIPHELERNVVSIFARAFIYALDGFDKFLTVLAKEAGVPQRVIELAESIDNILPNLRLVRNTTQHLEDRARGLGAGRNPQPIQLQPIENALISAPGGGVIVLNSLNGNSFGCTMSDGHYGEVEISPNSLLAVRQVLQEVLLCFQWKGPIQHAPSA